MRNDFSEPEIPLLLTIFRPFSLHDYLLFIENEYRKSFIRSRLCIVLDLDFHRLVLEVLQKLRLLVQNFSLGLRGDGALFEPPRNTKKIKN